jgi:poly-gamma-glutamate synthesis protein (capsule biosynthesis protein)
MKNAAPGNYQRRLFEKHKNSVRLFSGLQFRYLILILILLTIIFFQTAAVLSGQTVSQTVEIAAVGDILLDRGVEKRIKQFGADYPFEKVKNILADADLAFGNLENPVTGECDSAKKKFSFRAKSEHSKILHDAGIYILSLANNHSFDCGQTGLFETFINLKNENLRWIGAGKSETVAETPLFIEIKGIKIAFLGFTAISPLKSPNIAFATIEKVARTVASARRKADFVIVSFHWGTEYSSSPNARQIELANAAIEAGADVVFGHHPHVLQGFQMRDQPDGKRRALVAYSLGNFVFDSPVRLNKKVAESVILKVRFGKNGLIGAEIIPVSIKNFRPVIAREEKKEFIWNRLNCLSEKFGTALNHGQLIILPKFAGNLC